MKKIMSFSVTILALSLVSCIKESAPSGNEPLGNMTVTAGVKSSDTRISINDLTLNWQAGDKIGVWDGTTPITQIPKASSYEFTLSGGAGTKMATFSGTIADRDIAKPARVMYATYPADAISGESMGDACATFDLPDNQIQNGNTDAGFATKYLRMWADPVTLDGIAPSSASVSFIFRHLVAVLDFPVTGVPVGQKVVKVSLSGVENTYTATQPEYSRPFLKRMEVDRRSNSVSGLKYGPITDVAQYVNALSVSVNNHTSGSNITVRMTVFPRDIMTNAEGSINAPLPADMKRDLTVKVITTDASSGYYEYAFQKNGVDTHLWSPGKRYTFTYNGGTFDLGKVAAVPKLSNGRRVLLQRGLQIQSLGFIEKTTPPEHYQTWKNANFTSYNAWNNTTPTKQLLAIVGGGWPQTLPWGRWANKDGSTTALMNNEKQNKDYLVCMQYADELNMDMTLVKNGTLKDSLLTVVAAAFTSWRNDAGNNFLAYTNFWAGRTTDSRTMTPAGMDAYMRATNPDMLMFDAYPLHYVSFDTWYQQMQIFRLTGLRGVDGSGQQPLPYAQYLDLYRSDVVGGYAGPLPDESFVRLQQFASWAFGFTFLNAFVYNKPHDATVFPVMFSSEGDVDKTVTYNYVAETNRQSLNLGPALVRMLSSDVRIIPGNIPGLISKAVSGRDKDTEISLDGKLPPGISKWERGAGGNDCIVSITPVTSPGGGASGSYNDVVIGYFEPLLPDNSSYPFAEGTHFMIVNGARSGTAASQAQWYHIEFDFGASGFNSLQRLSRNTGQVEEVALTPVSGTQYSLDLNLEGGTGDMFRFWKSGQ